MGMLVVRAASAIPCFSQCCQADCLTRVLYHTSFSIVLIGLLVIRGNACVAINYTSLVQSCNCLQKSERKYLNKA